MDQELISYLDKRFDSIEADIKGLKTDVQELKTDVQGLKTDVQGLKADVQELKADVEGLKTEVKEIKKDSHETRILLEGLRGDVQMIAEGLATGFDEGLKPLRSEYDQKVDEVRSIQQLSFSDLRRRVQVLEDWKERLAGTDPIAMVRERFELKPKEV